MVRCVPATVKFVVAIRAIINSVRERRSSVLINLVSLDCRSDKMRSAADSTRELDGQARWCRRVGLMSRHTHVGRSPADHHHRGRVWSARQVAANHSRLCS